MTPVEEEVEGGGPDEEEVEPPRSWMKKVELPIFEGSDLLGWVARAEKFFKVQQFRPLEKLRLAFISMEGNDVHGSKFGTKNPRTLLGKSFPQC